MKVFLDSCVWGGSLKELLLAGFDVVWAGSLAQDPGDNEILSLAHREGRILVTLDKDFGELVIVHGKPHHGILRLVNIPARKQSVLCLQVLRRYGKELEAGAIITAEMERLRIRPPDDWNLAV